MNNDTPANDIKLKDLKANTKALVDLLFHIPLSDVKNVLDIRYGTGLWARVLLEMFPEARIVGFEADPTTAEGAWMSESVRLQRKRFEPGNYVANINLLLADFNVGTVLSREPLDEAIRCVTPAYLIFTDVAVGKLHLNYKSYGLKKADLTEYWIRFEVEGYELVTYSKRHHAASTALYQRKNPAG